MNWSTSYRTSGEARTAIRSRAPKIVMAFTVAAATVLALTLVPAKVNTDVRYTAVLRTNPGAIVIGLNSRAPGTVNSFVHLAEAGLFNHTQCHRLITAGIYIL